MHCCGLVRRRGGRRIRHHLHPQPSREMRRIERLRVNPREQGRDSKHNRLQNRSGCARLQHHWLRLVRHRRDR